MEVNIVTATFGNLPVVRECMESWLPLPAGWKLWVYDSRASELDGTKEYVKDACARAGGTCVDDKRNLWHTLAINELLKHIHSGWVLHLDSDAKLLDRIFYDWVASEIPASKNRQWGRVTHCDPVFAKDPRGFRMVLPRAFAWLMLFDQGFMRQRGADFEGIGIRGRKIGGKIPGEVSKEVHSGAEDVLVFGDTGWQLFWEALQADVFGVMPDHAWNCWQHKRGASQQWKTANEVELKHRGLL